MQKNLLGMGYNVENYSAVWDTMKRLFCHVGYNIENYSTVWDMYNGEKYSAAWENYSAVWDTTWKIIPLWGIQCGKIFLGVGYN